MQRVAIAERQAREDAMLRDLYATESRVIPTQDNRPLELSEPGPRAAARGAQPLCR